MTHSLIAAYKLLSHMKLITPSPAGEYDITEFHSKAYVDFLRKSSDQDDKEKINSEEADEYGLGK